SGKPLFNHCDHVGDDASFYSGHAAATMTMAGATCVHHQHLPLYGGGFPDLLPCLVMLGMSGATGIGRIVADRHYASDVVVGWGFGFASGYVLPSILHYGFKSDRPVGAVVGKSFGVVPIPQAYPGGAGLSFGGYF
ncbi:MAG: phosphatase PAP2 family protein, partial [Polyangiaceae bacterium]